MKQLRQWEIEPNSPYEMNLSADARINQTDYTDDQVWTVEVGRGDAPALGLYTQYGARVGLASLIPLWTHGNHVIYQAQTYATPLKITSFAPSYICAEGELLPNVAFKAQHFALDSHSIAGIYSVTNATSQVVDIRFEWFAHVGARGEEQKLGIATWGDDGCALSLGTNPFFAPIVILENGQPTGIGKDGTSPKIGRNLLIPAKSTVSFRWVHVGYQTVQESLAQAQSWLVTDWKAFLATIQQASTALPQYQTGSQELDLVLTSSVHKLIQSFLRPCGIFAHGTIVAGRQPTTGFSKKGDGSDHPRMWEGQSPEQAFMTLPLMATIDSTLAEGVIRNYIATQRQDGFIDLKPGAARQSQNLLCTPILARTAWMIYDHNQNSAFIEAIYDGLKRFFYYWIQQDRDQDGLPEWQHERQTGYTGFPTFAGGLLWAQGADIGRVESPDLLAYLISEADALLAMAQLLKQKKDVTALKDAKTKLTQALNSLWADTHFIRRDRDSHITTIGQELLKNGAGDALHTINRPLAVPNRVIVRIVGGVSHTPAITLRIIGIDSDGKSITENAQPHQITWQTRQGIYTSQAVFSEITSIQCEGLSRAYRVSATTMDTTQIDLMNLLPLGLIDLPKSQQTKLAQLATDPKRFYAPNGITQFDLQSQFHDPDAQKHAGGIWLYWQTLMAQGLIRAGQEAKANDIFKRNVSLLSNILSQQHQFSQFYDSQSAQAMGERGHILGIAPLMLFHALIGITILSHQQVKISSAFGWGKTITIRQHGVTVKRTTKSIKIVFPSGYTFEAKSEEITETVIHDPQATEAKPLVFIRQPFSEGERKTATKQPPTGKVSIKVEHEE